MEHICFWCTYNGDVSFLGYMVLRSMSAHMADDVMGAWRKLHHEEGHRLYFLRDVIRVKTSRRVRQLGRVVCMGNVHKYVAWKLEGNNPLVRPSHRWEGNISSSSSDFFSLDIIACSDVHWSAHLLVGLPGSLRP
jgi:hypothetical protein